MIEPALARRIPNQGNGQGSQAFDPPLRLEFRSSAGTIVVPNPRFHPLEVLVFCIHIFLIVL